MKIALCFWGICRSTDITIDSIENNIFNVLKQNNIEYDVYLHTFTMYRPYTNERAKEFSLDLKNTIWKLLKPTEHIIEHQDLIDTKLHFEKYRTCGNPWKDDCESFSTLDNVVRSLYSLKKVTELWSKNSAKYDAIIYLRPDVLFIAPLEIQWLKNLQPNCILIPNFHLTENCNDRFAIGKPNTMKIFGNRFDDAYEYSLTKILHSERYLSYIIQKNNIQIIHIPFIFKRIRADGTICEGDKKL
jgi:hypothetical protein